MLKEEEKAVKEFLERKKENSKKKRINNADLSAGDPMYYYCRHCGAEDKKPECFRSASQSDKRSLQCV